MHSENAFFAAVIQFRKPVKNKKEPFSLHELQKRMQKTAAKTQGRLLNCLDYKGNNNATKYNTKRLINPVN